MPGKGAWRNELYRNVLTVFGQCLSLKFDAAKRSTLTCQSFIRIVHPDGDMRWMTVKDTATTANISSRWVRTKTKCRNGWFFLGHASTRVGVWLLSLVALVGAPCLPLLIELLKIGTIGSNSIYITASVMCVGFVFMAENTLIRVVYIVLFSLTLIFNMVSGPYSPELNSWSSIILIGVCVLHASERAYWHVALDRPFPERTS